MEKQWKEGTEGKRKKSMSTLQKPSQNRCALRRDLEQESKLAETLARSNSVSLTSVQLYNITMDSKCLYCSKGGYCKQKS